MTKDEAMKLALEALENISNWLPTIGQKGLRDYEAEAITAIKAALAQPEQDQFKPDWNTEAVLVEEMQRMAKRIKELEALAQPEQEPLEYWNAVEGWVKIDEVRQHFDSVGCGTIYKTAGEGREPLYTTPPPCPTCEALARTVMLDQTGRDA